MAYEEPGVKVIQQLTVAAPNIAAAPQVLTLVGPMYEVLEGQSNSVRYNATTGATAQEFAWEGQKTSSVVDLSGVRSDTSEPDEQLLESAEFPMSFQLRDPELGTSFDVNLLTDVFDVDQDGFQIIEGSAAATARASGGDGSGAQANRFHVSAGGLISAGIAVGDKIRVANGTYDVHGDVTAFADDDVTFDVQGGDYTLFVAAVAADVQLDADLGTETILGTLPPTGWLTVGSGSTLERVRYTGISQPGGFGATEWRFALDATTPVNFAHAIGEGLQIQVMDAVAKTTFYGDIGTTPGSLVDGQDTPTINFTGDEGARLAIWVEQLAVVDGSVNGVNLSLIETSGLSIDSGKVGMKAVVWSDSGAETEAQVDGDLDTPVPTNTMSSAAASFTADMVGNYIKISGQYRRITAVNSSTEIVFDGADITGTGATYQVYHPNLRNITSVDSGGTDFYVDGDVTATGGALPVTIHRPVYRDVSTVTSATEVVYSGSAISSDTGQLVDVPFELFNADVTYEAFPDYEVLMTFRALDVALAADTSTVYTATDIAALGSVHKSNPLLWAAQSAIVAMGTDDTAIFLQPVDLWALDTVKSGLPEDMDETQGYLEALELLSALDNVYFMVPLTQNSTVRDAFVSHVDAMSVAEEKKERVCYLSYAIPLGDVESLSGEIAPGLNGGNKQISDPGANFITNGIVPGMEVEVQTPERFAGTYVVGSGSTEDVLELTGDNWGQDSLGVYESEFKDYEITDGDFDAVAGELDSATTAAFKDVQAGDYILFGTATRLVSSIASGSGGTYSKILYAGSALSGTGATVSILRSDVASNYYANPMDKTEQAAALAAISQTRANRRVLHMWPDLVEQITGTDSQGNEVREYLPSFYYAAAEAGRDAVIPPERSSTGADLAGFTGLQHSNTYFNTTQLNTIAGGGWAILEQATTSGPVSMRHLLTTDMSTVKNQELAFTKNVDNMAKVKRASVEPLLNDSNGRINITQDFLTSLAFPFQAIFEQFEANEQIVRTAGTPSYKILSIRQDPTALDTILEDVELNVPLPANKVTVTFII